MGNPKNPHSVNDILFDMDLSLKNPLLDDVFIEIAEKNCISTTDLMMLWSFKNKMSVVFSFSDSKKVGAVMNNIGSKTMKLEDFDRILEVFQKKNCTIYNNIFLIR